MNDTIIAPYGGRAKIDLQFDRLTITIPSKKHWFFIAFLSFWLCGWATGLVAVGSEVLSHNFSLLNGGSWFVALWLSLWTLGGAAALSYYFKMLLGVEILEFGPNTFSVFDSGYLWSKRKVYDLNSIKNFSVLPLSTHDRRPNTLGEPRIGFDYGLQSLTCAVGIDAPEAHFLLQQAVEKGFLKPTQLMQLV
jgi:hypothetical protein